MLYYSVVSLYHHDAFVLTSYPEVRHTMIRPAVIHRTQCFLICWVDLISAAAFAAACKGTLDESWGQSHGP
jgi:hypothetical protein